MQLKNPAQTCKVIRRWRSRARNKTDLFGLPCPSNFPLHLRSREVDDCFVMLVCDIVAGYAGGSVGRAGEFGRGGNDYDGRFTSTPGGPGYGGPVAGGAGRDYDHF